jgi:hypothetical protein
LLVLRKQDHPDPDLRQVSLYTHSPSQTHSVTSLCIASSWIAPHRIASHRIADLLHRLCTRSLRADDVQERVEVIWVGDWVTGKSRGIRGRAVQWGVASSIAAWIVLNSFISVDYTDAIWYHVSVT